TNGGIRAFTFSLSVNGEYNGNGKGDAADYVVWRNDLGLTAGATKSQGDGTGDGNVAADGHDYWEARFGNGSGSGSGSVAAGVPEPSTVAMLLVSLLIG